MHFAGLSESKILYNPNGTSEIRKFVAPGRVKVFAQRVYNPNLISFTLSHWVVQFTVIV